MIYCNCSTTSELDYFGCDIQENKPLSKDRWVGKVNFVEIRSFWHLFRSFDRMWSFFILCLQVEYFFSLMFTNLDVVEKYYLICNSIFTYKNYFLCNS